MRLQDFSRRYCEAVSYPCFCVFRGALIAQASEFNRKEREGDARYISLDAACWLANVSVRIGIGYQTTSRCSPA
jgi:hypothetical protein